MAPNCESTDSVLRLIDDLLSDIDECDPSIVLRRIRNSVRGEASVNPAHSQNRAKSDADA